MTDAIDYDISNALGYQVSLTARVLERNFEQSIKLIDLNRTNWTVLLSVNKPEINSPSQIAEFIGIDRTATSRALRQLDSDGLVQRLSGEKDKRTRQVELTTKGRELLAKSLPYAQANAQHFSQKLTDDERDQLVRILVKLRENETGGLAHL